MRLLSVLIFVAGGSTIFAENIDVDLSVDRSNWKDPWDPFAMYSNDEKNALESCKKELALCRGDCKVYFFASISSFL